MGLAKYINKALRTEIALGTESFSVRGISYADLMILKDRYGEALSSVFSKIQEGQDEVEVIMLLLNDAPQVVNLLIALASLGPDEDLSEDDVIAASGLPMSVQTEALIEICKLTFPGDDGLKKFIATAIQVIKALTRTVEDLSGITTDLSKEPSST